MFTLIPTETFQVGDTVKIVGLFDEYNDVMDDDNNLIGETGIIYSINDDEHDGFPYRLVLHRDGEICEDCFQSRELLLINH
jgi:hypothetical protein